MLSIDFCLLLCVCVGRIIHNLQLDFDEIVCVACFNAMTLNSRFLAWRKTEPKPSLPRGKLHNTIFLGHGAM